jgi:hypothetical protein
LRARRFVPFASFRAPLETFRNNVVALVWRSQSARTRSNLPNLYLFGPFNPLWRARAITIARLLRLTATM